MPIVWTDRAEKDARKLPNEVQARVVDALDRLYHQGHGDVRQLKGYQPSRSRLRVGDYRVIFQEEGDTLLVLRVRHRKAAY